MYMTIFSINIDDIFKSKNEIVKVWAYYWKWAGLWKPIKLVLELEILTCR